MTARSNRPDLTNAELLEILEHVRRRTGIPGLAALVNVRGNLIAAQSGLADVASGRGLCERSRFEVSCLMKLFTAVVFLTLMADRKWDLSTPVCEFLPEWKTPSVAGVHVAHLLSHSAGYAGLDVSDAPTKWGYSWDKFVKHVTTAAALFPPGTVFNYEHSEHVVLDHIMRRITGRSAVSWIRELLIDEAGAILSSAAADQGTEASVSQHAWDSSTASYTRIRMPACGSFWEASLPDCTISLLDLDRVVAKSLMSLEAHYQRAGLSRLLAHEEVALVLPLLSLTHAEVIPVGYGLLCGQYSTGLIGCNGSVQGQTVAFRITRDDEARIFVAASTWAPGARDSVVEAIREALLGEKPAPSHLSNSASAIESHSRASPAELAGKYRGSYFGMVEVVSSDTTLDIRCGSTGKGPKARAVVRRTSNGYELENGTPMNMAFSSHPEDGTPVLHLGMHAYRRELA